MANDDNVRGKGKDFVEGCPLCENPEYPVPHHNSRFCESGKRPHCTCDMCF